MQCVATVIHRSSFPNTMSSCAVDQIGPSMDHDGEANRSKSPVHSRRGNGFVGVEAARRIKACVSILGDGAHLLRNGAKESAS